MEKREIAQTMERRFTPGLEIRAEDDKPTQIEGIAAKVGTEYDMGWYIERVMPGAFDDVMDDDVRVLFNHDPDQILGRTISGTAEIYLTSEGHLGYRYTTPDRTYAKDLEDAIRSGDVSQSSWAFTIAKQTWIEEKRGDRMVEVRQIDKVDRLYDVSPVTYPANPDTSVAKRSHEDYIARKEEVECTEGGEREARLREVRLSIIKGEL